MSEIWMQNTGAKINLRSLETVRQAEFYDPSLVAYVLQDANRGGRYRVVTSGGSLANTQPGSHCAAYSAQAGRYLGSFVVVAIWYFGSGEVYGTVPQRTLPHYVCK